MIGMMKCLLFIYVYRKYSTGHQPNKRFQFFCWAFYVIFAKNLLFSPKLFTNSVIGVKFNRKYYYPMGDKGEILYVQICVQEI